MTTLECTKHFVLMELSVTRVSCSAAADVQLDNYTRLKICGEFNNSEMLKMFLCLA